MMRGVGPSNLLQSSYDTLLYHVLIFRKSYFSFQKMLSVRVNTARRISGTNIMDHSVVWRIYSRAIGCLLHKVRFYREERREADFVSRIDHETPPTLAVSDKCKKSGSATATIALLEFFLPSA